MTHVGRGRVTLLLITAIAIGLTILGASEVSNRQPSIGILAIIIGGVVYVLAWVIAVLDCILARRYRWSLALAILMPLGIGPLLYGLFGLRSSRSDEPPAEPMSSIDVP
jgi:hypothetical protein